MMKEYIVLITPKDKTVFSLPEEEQKKHIEKVGDFIIKKTTEGTFLNAQPFEENGTILEGSAGNFREIKKKELDEQIAGFYHVSAKNMEHVLSILKGDPRFEDGSWSMEIRPILSLKGINN